MRRWSAWFGATIVALASSLLANEGCLGYLDADAGVPRGDGGDAAPVDDARAADVTAGGSDGEADAGCSSEYACAVLAQRPLLYLRLDEKSGLNAVDSSGHGRNGTFSLAEIALGAEGAIASEPAATAVDFTGPSGEIQMPAGLDFAGMATFAFTVEFWIKPGPFNELRFLIDHQDYDPRRGWLMALDLNGELALEMWENEASLFVGRATGAIASGVWQHVVFSFDNTSRAVAWVNKQVVVNTQWPLDDAGGVVLPATGIWRIGRQNCSPGCEGPTYAGALDELAIYDHVFDQQIVDEHYAKSGR